MMMNIVMRERQKATHQEQHTNKTKKKKSPSSSKLFQRHSKDSPSGGFESLLPSLVGVGILVFAILAQRGFRGRVSVAGIDLGTTNSVLCVQTLSKGVGDISCVPDTNGSPIVPSVVSFLEVHERPVGPSTKIKSLLYPHPSQVVVGYQAKPRIDSHPHHTLYHAKRVLGKSMTDPEVIQFQKEVDFVIGTSLTTSTTNNNNKNTNNNHDNDNNDNNSSIVFAIAKDTTPSHQQQHDQEQQQQQQYHTDDYYTVSPQQVGGYVVYHLLQLAQKALGHSNIKGAVIAVPAKFTPYQRQLTAQAFQLAGLQVHRILEEPTAAALAYGLHRKPNVDKILVYDFGGGTLDVSILHVSDGFVDVMGCDGDDTLGGADFDVAIAHHFERRHVELLRNLQSYYQHHNQQHQHDDDWNTEAFIAQCPRINDTIPLCSVSSFHTLGEAMKIQLSTILMQQQEQQNDTTTTTNNNNASSNMVVSTQCWALPHKSSIPSSSSTTTTTPTTTMMKTSLCESLYLQTMTLSLDEYNTIAQPLV